MTSPNTVTAWRSAGKVCLMYGLVYCHATAAMVHFLNIVFECVIYNNLNIIHYKCLRLKLIAIVDYPSYTYDYCIKLV